MYAPDGGPNRPRELPDALAERLEDLDERSLRFVSQYVDELLAEHSTPIAEDVRQEAHGAVLDVEDRGTHALVTKRIPDPHGPDEDESIVSVYRVTREWTPDGEPNLHWVFMRDASDLPTTCANCGASLPEDAHRCPRCGDRTTRYDGGER